MKLNGLLVGIIIIYAFFNGILPSTNLLQSKNKVTVSSDSCSTNKGVCSPDKEYIAIRHEDAGGGGISPYCIDYIYVGSTKAKTLNDTDIVYTADCHSFDQLENNTMVNAPLIKWLSNSEIQITFSPDKASKGADVKLKGYVPSSTGRVKVSYVSRD